MMSPFRNIPPLSVIESAEQDADNIDDLPDQETATRQNLQNTRKNFPRINTVQPTATRAKQQTS